MKTEEIEIIVKLRVPNEDRYHMVNSVSRMIADELSRDMMFGAEFDFEIHSKVDNQAEVLYQYSDILNSTGDQNA